MTFTRLLLRNLVWHWRPNTAVLLGVAVGAAVLTGALLVGDSLRGSLRALALDQLGWVESSLVAGRFFREELANEIPVAKACPAILLQGSASSVGPEVAHANKVNIIAVDDRFWPAGEMPLNKFFWTGKQRLEESIMRPLRRGVVLNQPLADQLHLTVGDKVVLFLQNAANVPRETLLGKRKSDDVVSQLEVKVERVLPNDGMAGFTLRPSPALPLNAFVPLWLIQYHLGADKSQMRGRVNAILMAGAKEQLADALRADLTLADWGLTVRTPSERATAQFTMLAAGEDRRPEWQGKLRKYRWAGRIPNELATQASEKGELTRAQFVEFFDKNHAYLSLESEQVFIEPVVSSTAIKAANQLGWRVAPTLAYMVDTLSDGKNQEAYVIVAALDPDLPAPLGPIQLPSSPPLKDGEILLANWAGRTVQPTVGQWLSLGYDVPDTAGKLERHETKLHFTGWVSLKGAADDADLTPRFPGITDRLSIRDWAEDLPFPVDRRRLKLADSEYWDRYRATPKAYVTLATGKRLWSNRFGTATSLRIAPPIKAGTPEQFQSAAAVFDRELRRHLDPVGGGFLVNDVKQLALAASEGGTDFGGLFLMFSCILIVAALLLVGLMFRLGLDRRAGEMGLLLAVGWQTAAVRRLALWEGFILAVGGGVLGVAGAVLYSGFLLDYLGMLWPGGLDRSFLRLYVTWQSVLIGYFASLAVSVLTIWWTTRVLAKVPPRSLLAGATLITGFANVSRGWVAPTIVLAAPVLAVACLAAGSVSADHEAQASSFFLSGFLVLAACLAALWWWMRRTGHGHGVAMPGLARLGFRNAARHPLRSLLTVGLLATATFLVVAVQVFHREPGSEFLSRSGGSGGFAWVGDASVPIFQDLNSPAGRANVGLPQNLDAHFLAFRVQAGDDASCLNLYQPRRPRILGVPASLIDHDGFRFASSLAKNIDTSPWQLLLDKTKDGAVPAIGEDNTVEWMLKSGLGEDIEIRDGSGQQARLQIVALLEDSVFQSELLIGEKQFLKLFPRQEGFQLFLIHAPPGQGGERIRQTLETALADYGFSMTPAQERLQSYLDVENTYLATFQALGGLGMLLGTLGLAVVLVRSVWERRGELALLRALGFRQSALGWLVLAENAWLLALGLLFGFGAALVAVSPFLATQGGDVLQPRLVWLLGLAVIVGLAAGGLAMKAALSAPLLPALRRE